MTLFEEGLGTWKGKNIIREVFIGLDLIISNHQSSSFECHYSPQKVDHSVIQRYTDTYTVSRHWTKMRRSLGMFSRLSSSTKYLVELIHEEKLKCTEKSTDLEKGKYRYENGVVVIIVVTLKRVTRTPTSSRLVKTAG
ncbi:hypothetical protein V1478_016692 [Vespula squamosa]|uniref:Uncharacterized protein n=1 Tax=Vespula squamosa TaxID=30214 RepID=A0ABD2A0I9_VESSQ